MQNSIASLSSSSSRASSTSYSTASRLEGGAQSEMVHSMMPSAKKAVAESSKSSVPHILQSPRLEPRIFSETEVKQLAAEISQHTVKEVSLSRLKYWDMPKASYWQSFSIHKNSVWALVRLPNGQIASTSSDATVKIWDPQTGRCSKTLEGHTGIVYCILAMDRLLISGSADQTIKLWDVDTGRCVRTLSGHRGDIKSLVALPQNHFASASKDRAIKIWDIKSGQCTRTLSGHENAVVSLTVGAEEQQLISASQDETIKIWDSQKGQCLATINAEIENAVSSLTMLPGQRLVGGFHNGMIKIWDLHDLKHVTCLKTLRGHTDKVLTLVGLANGQQLASGSEDKSIKLWDVQTGRCLATLTRHTGAVRDLVYLPEGQLISASYDGSIFSWQLVRNVTFTDLKPIFVAMRNNPSVETLDLSYNPGLDDRLDSEVIAGISQNSQLRELGLFGTKMTLEGIGILAKALGYDMVHPENNSLTILHEGLGTWEKYLQTCQSNGSSSHVSEMKSSKEEEHKPMILEQSHLKDLKEQESVSAKKIEELKREYEAKLTLANQQIQSRQQDLDQQKAQSMKMEKELNLAKAGQEKLEKQLEESKNTLSALQDEVQIYQKQRGEQASALTDALKKGEGAQYQENQLRHQLATCQKQLSVLESEYREQKVEWEKKVEASELIQAELKRVKVQLQTHEAHIKQLEAQLEEGKKAIRAQKEEYEKKLAEQKESVGEEGPGAIKLKDVQEQLEKVQQKLEQEKAKVVVEREEGQRQISEQKEAADQLQQSLAKKEKELGTAVSQFKALQDQLAEKRKEMEQTVLQKQKEMEQTALQLVEQKKQQEDQNKKSDEEKAKYQQEIEKLREDYGRELQKLKSELESKDKKITTLRTKLKTKQTKTSAEEQKNNITVIFSPTMTNMSEVKQNAKAEQKVEQKVDQKVEQRVEVQLEIESLYKGYEEKFAADLKSLANTSAPQEQAQESKLIASDPALDTYYHSLMGQFSSLVNAFRVVASGKDTDSSLTRSESVGHFIMGIVQKVGKMIPVIGGAVDSIAGIIDALISRSSENEKKAEAVELASYFPEVSFARFLELLSRKITLKRQKELSGLSQEKLTALASQDCQTILDAVKQSHQPVPIEEAAIMQRVEALMGLIKTQAVVASESKSSHQNGATGNAFVKEVIQLVYAQIESDEKLSSAQKSAMCKGSNRETPLESFFTECDVGNLSVGSNEKKRLVEEVLEEIRYSLTEKPAVEETSKAEVYRRRVKAAVEKWMYDGNILSPEQRESYECARSISARLEGDWNKSKKLSLVRTIIKKVLDMNISLVHALHTTGGEARDHFCAYVKNAIQASDLSKHFSIDSKKNQKSLEQKLKDTIIPLAKDELLKELKMSANEFEARYGGGSGNLSASSCSASSIGGRESPFTASATSTAALLASSLSAVLSGSSSSSSTVVQQNLQEGRKDRVSASPSPAAQ